MTIEQLKHCYEILSLPKDNTREYNWYKQLYDLTYDMCLTINQNRPGKLGDAVICDILRGMNGLKSIYNGEWGWKAHLHKTWQDFLKDAKQNGVHPEWDISTKTWIWIDNEQKARLLGILEQLE